MNKTLLEQKRLESGAIQVQIVKIEEVELDEMWSFVGKKSNQRWLWHAIDHNTHEVLAYHFGTRKDKVFRALQKKLSCFDIDFYFTDDWGLRHEVAKESCLPQQCEKTIYITR